MQGGWATEDSIIDTRLTGHGVEQFTTQRIVGRRLLPADLEFLTTLHSSESVMAAHGGVRSEAATEPFVRSNVAHWRHCQFGLYILSLADEPDEPIGRAGLRWDRDAGETPAVDLSIVLVEAAWGQGFATEAGMAAVAIARSLELPMVAGCRADHDAARRVMDKIGFVYTEDYRRHDEDWARFAWPEGLDSPSALILRDSGQQT